MSPLQLLGFEARVFQSGNFERCCRTRISMAKAVFPRCVLEDTWHWRSGSQGPGPIRRDTYQQLKTCLQEKILLRRKNYCYPLPGEALSTSDSLWAWDLVAAGMGSCHDCEPQVFSAALEPELMSEAEHLLKSFNSRMSK